MNQNLRDWKVTMHVPRALIFYSFIIIGSFLAPVVYLDRLLLSLLAAFFYLQISAYALDELKGRHCDTSFSDSGLMFRACLGLQIAGVMGVMLFVAVSWWLLPLAIIGVLFVVAYNYEVLGAHSRVIFSVVWGAFPVLAHYILHTLEIPPLHVWMFAVFAAVFSYQHIICYGNYRCRVEKCKDLDAGRDCHGNYCCVRRNLVTYDIHRLQKKITNLQTVIVVLLSFAIVVMYYV